jgi:uncharacterized protein (TIGR03084 family)
MDMGEREPQQPQVVEDLRAEGDELFALLKDMDTGFWRESTAFKAWTVWDVVAHLHFSDHMALTSIRSDDEIKRLFANLKHTSPADAARHWICQADHPPTGPDLLIRWRDLFLALCDALQTADPARRFLWAGPGMKARMFASARQMETWAHGFEVYDLMGITRSHTDRIRNIAELGVRTYAWSFRNRRLEVPHELPHVQLTAPSGAVWQWHDPASEHQVVGDAIEFCQVVTQVRHLQDTSLVVSGDNARAWMKIAQCFAGPPADPPPPGSRHP